MEELRAVPFISWIDERFKSMLVPGEAGIAVSYETNDSSVCLSVGRIGDACKKYLLKGKPLQLHRECDISLAEYNSMIYRLSDAPKQNGMIVADVIDGESFMVKWVERDAEFRFILSNPHELDSEYYRSIGVVLEDFFKAEGNY